MTEETVTVERSGLLTGDQQQLSAMLPSACPQNHAANLLPLPDGDLLCTWFAGTQEGIADISIYCSRLEKGSDRWSAAEKLSEDPTRSEQNPVLFLDPDDTLWLLYTAQKSGNQDTAIVRYRQSADFGRSWGVIETLLDQPGTFIRQPVVVLDNGDWLLPVFYCRTTPGEKWVGNNDDSAVKISSDKGKSWRDVAVPESTGCVHMNITLLKDGSLLALYRSRWADFIYQSRSTDGGNSWSAPQATELPNNNSSIQVTTLNNGHLALVFNKMSAADATERRASLYDEIEDEDDDVAVALEPKVHTGRSAFWGAPRAPMTLAISTDGGKSWPQQRNLDEGDGYCMTNNSQQKLNREFSYPSIKQGVNGELHIAYTYFRQAIKYVRVNEEWLTGEQA
ncbi:exo-alpha-sialidase [Erwiniaceae bacterium BAC15a-03b]|uniref:Exo-alpha-sialidase n=1 Tax=Winslowiella arboricola TaxID=2978220 RepID=A0A9J6PNW1_9GAMM|nr:sialidase family protein [Winslowiella arboricola]MCU5771163.1 exo-alpha-sialidase [Winslowiella arboricola]MCU5776364.1 exo-alpha-sialidase [Winslowiella arboricola]